MSFKQTISTTLKSCAWLVLLSTFGWASSAAAFCGFYVAGGESTLFNDATQVAMMRSGTTTVLSMQNNYQGPPENFAMVIPVPVVLQETSVKTLPVSLFQKMDQLSAPRLVEYWEQDPCYVQPPDEGRDMLNSATMDSAEADSGGGGGVQVEAEFSVGEYDIVVLSTNDATALDTWLQDNDYSIPEGASPYFEPYVQEGMYFFVAKVDITKVTMNGEQAVLSPIRFHYDAETFSLPVRLGLINSQGEQDLIVYTLGQGQRYELANRENVFIPTNIEVVNDVREDFGGFYRTLFDATLEYSPNAAVTEYSWDASTCDPCPGPTLDSQDLLTLGADVATDGQLWGWTLTRLHMRYSAETLGDDLVFAEAGPVVGGRELYNDSGELEETASFANFNNFQGRYIIRHRWNLPITCELPVFGRWGGPPGGESSSDTQTSQSPNTTGESDAASTGSYGLGGASEALSDLVRDDVPEIGVASSSGCACSSTSSGAAGFLFIAAFLMGIWCSFIRRRLFS
ncbi:MAG: DUF2330 domain-containing protein [Deltaproteobacteria bacterium]|nr:DUF2330 domain-containing protein [Deltaproteobacteria bacterium]